jgi:hypothetical protein
VGVLTDYFVVTDAEFERLKAVDFDYEQFPPPDAEWKAMDLFVVCCLEGVLFNRPHEDCADKVYGSSDTGYIWSEGDQGPWVALINPETVQRLAELNDVYVRMIGLELNLATDLMFYENDEAIEYVDDLRRASKKAIERQANLMLWVCL